MRSVKILHVNDNFHYRGGVEQYLLGVVDLLAQAGHESVVLYREGDPDTVRGAQCPAYLVEKDHSQVWPRISAIIEAERPDVAYIHQTSSERIIGAVAELLPTIAYVHGVQPVCPGLAKYFRRGDEVCNLACGWRCVPMHYLRRCSAARRPRTVCNMVIRAVRLRKALRSLPRVFVATPYMRALLVQNGFDPGQISILPPHFVPDDGLPDFCLPEDPGGVLFAGRLEVEKGLPYLLRAFAQIPPPAKLVVAGDGTLRGQYERMAQELDLSSRVWFRGWLSADEMKRAYRHCSVLVVPSICPEPFGKVGIEALSHGRPVVAFDVGGISDWLCDGDNGFLVEPRDTQMLAAKIAEILANTQMRAAMGNSGRTMVGRCYSAERHLTTLLSSFDALRSVCA